MVLALIFAMAPVAVFMALESFVTLLRVAAAIMMLVYGFAVATVLALLVPLVAVVLLAPIMYLPLPLHHPWPLLPLPCPKESSSMAPPELPDSVTPRTLLDLTELVTMSRHLSYVSTLTERMAPTILR